MKVTSPAGCQVYTIRSRTVYGVDVFVITFSHIFYSFDTYIHSYTHTNRQTDKNIGMGEVQIFFKRVRTKEGGITGKRGNK